MNHLRAAAVAMLLALMACDNPSEPSPALPFEETDGQRLARQKQYVAAINRYLLPAPAGQAESVASAAIKEAGSPCGRVEAARRFDSDGTIVAKCTNGRDFRVFNIEGAVDTFPLDCTRSRQLIGVDACDEQSIAQGSDKSLVEVIDSLDRIKG